jgi:acetolactate decarboxylase
VELSESVWTELKRLQDQRRADLSTIIDTTLADAFELERHALFQVSTSSALVKGVFAGAITVAQLKRHGDTGLGTFAGLDGELVMVEGECFRATAGGVVARADDEREVPFALVTRFVPDLEAETDRVSDIRSLQLQLDRHRPSQNIFAGVRVDGVFHELKMRAACPARDGEGLVAATRHQSEFSASGVEGTLIGFWAPDYTRAVSVPGHHLHFISADRSLGGHVLEMKASRLRIQMQLESEVHLAIPETEEFLAADLDGDHRRALDIAETGRNRSDSVE